MNVFKKICDKTELREIRTSIKGGQELYYVVYITKYYYTLKIFNYTIKTWENTKSNNSYLRFSTANLAERYAKNTVKCDEYEDEYNWDDAVKIYPKGYEQLEQYGYFGIKGGNTSILPTNKYDYDYCSIFKFYFYDEDKYGLTYRLLLNDLFEPIDYDRIIKDKKLGYESKIVSAFNVATYEVIPIDKLNASSKEIAELKELLKEYEEKQQKYINFLNKLYEK